MNAKQIAERRRHGGWVSEIENDVLAGAYLDLLEQNRWIPVSERLPEEDETVFWWIVPKEPKDCPHSSSGRPIHTDFKPYRTEGKYQKCWSPLGRPTHWKPLPNVPEE